MKKLDSVSHAVWIATAVMSYNTYEKAMQIGRVDYSIFYFKQSEIVNFAQSLCNDEVANARVGQWFNGSHSNNTYNFLTEKDKSRRLSYKNEYNGIKEKPEGLILSEVIDTEFGEKTIGELINFVDN